VTLRGLCDRADVPYTADASPFTRPSESTDPAERHRRRLAQSPLAAAGLGIGVDLVCLTRLTSREALPFPWCAAAEMVQSSAFVGPYRFC